MRIKIDRVGIKLRVWFSIEGEEKQTRGGRRRRSTNQGCKEEVEKGIYVVLFAEMDVKDLGGLHAFLIRASAHRNFAR